MKFKVLLAAAIGLSVHAAAFAQETPRPVFTPEAFRAHVAFLGDDLLEGREAGSRGYDLAARYVAAQFEALGLRAGANGGWYQPVEFVRFGLSGTPRLTIGARSFAQGENEINLERGVWLGGQAALQNRHESRLRCLCGRLAWTQCSKGALNLN